jgi:general secretion pathway protein D
VKPSLRTLSLSVLVLALSGCAADMAYRDGRNLVEKDQVEAGC